MYKAVRSFKVQNADGSYRIVQPGEAVPEAESWPNRKAYIERNWLCREGEEPTNRHYSDSVRVATKAPVKAAKAPEAKPEAPAKAPEEPAAEAAPEAAPEAPEEAPLTEEALAKLSKNKVQELADSMGINPDQSKTKLIAGILAAATPE